MNDMRHKTEACQANRDVIRGFTLVELVIVLAVLTTLLSFAAPSFKGFAASFTQTREYNVFAADLRLARLEAIKRGGRVTICARATDTSCGSDWSMGWLLFADIDPSKVGTIDTGDTMIRLHSAEGDSELDISADAIVRPDDMAARDYVSFDARGRADWTVGTWTLCDERGAESALALVINGAGNSRKAVKANASATAVADALGDPVSCP